MAKKKKNATKEFDRVTTLGWLMVASVFAWTMYQLVNRGLADILRVFGMENFYLQGIVILIILGVLLTKFRGKKIDELLGAK